MKEIAIIGAGLVGRILAWRLNERYQSDCHITLIDQHGRDYFGTGLVAAAMVAPYTEAVNTEAVTQDLGVRSSNLWCRWLPQLEAKTGSAISFDQSGTLVVAHPQDDAVWQRFHIKAKAVVPDGKMQLLDQQAFDACEPQLATGFSKALLFEDEGAISNLDLYPALAAYFDQSDNIDWIENTPVNGFTPDGNIDGFDTPFDLVFDCRGNGAKADLNGFRSIRGEVARVYAPEVKFKHCVRLMHPRFPLYIAPRANHEYIIGATQIESDDDSAVTVRSGLELLSALYSLHQGFGEAHIIELLSALRPTFMSNQPRIEVTQRLIRINGLYRHGYLFAPALLEDVLHYLDGEQTRIRFPQFIFSDETSNHDSNQYQQQQANA